MTHAPFDAERYRSAAAHYERGRVPYASALIRRVAEVIGLGSQHRVLDLGCGPGRFGVIERRAIDVETLVQRALSMGSTSPAHLGENMPAMVAEIRAALADVREEVVETSALVAWRSHPGISTQ